MFFSFLRGLPFQRGFTLLGCRSTTHTRHCHASWWAKHWAHAHAAAKFGHPFAQRRLPSRLVVHVIFFFRFFCVVFLFADIWFGSWRSCVPLWLDLFFSSGVMISVFCGFASC
jgi:hypothetical protein